MRDESLTGYMVYDGIYTDYQGSTYSVWYAIVRGRLWFVEYCSCGLAIKRVEFQDVLA